MYRWIQKWGELAGISPEEVLSTLAEAWEQDAPADSVYRDGDGTWKTIADLGESAMADLGLAPAFGAAPTPAPGHPTGSPGQDARADLTPTRTFERPAAARPTDSPDRS